ncbi:copper resistance CopC family protein [Microbacterium gorillae]|uniref:copper resistance CopC family protein n=1 Tax=Microbacterium gorillae TaxID=1231063 RepID=UPI000694E78D|nr:copper resistance CopC family protein [Microbacterium gorillae]
MSRFRILLAATVVAAVAVFAVPTAAQAHDELTSSSPAPDTHLKTPPEQVELDFSADLLPTGLAVLVVDSAQTDHASGEPELNGNVVTVPVSDMADGSYEIRWRVVSSDGHPISGIVPFTVGETAVAPTPTTHPVIRSVASSRSRSAKPPLHRHPPPTRPPPPRPRPRRPPRRRATRTPDDCSSWAERARRSPCSC